MSVTLPGFPCGAITGMGGVCLRAVTSTFWAPVLSPTLGPDGDLQPCSPLFSFHVTLCSLARCSRNTVAAERKGAPWVSGLRPSLSEV